MRLRVRLGTNKVCPRNKSRSSLPTCAMHGKFSIPFTLAFYIRLLPIINWNIEPLCLLQCLCEARILETYMRRCTRSNKPRDASVYIASNFVLLQFAIKSNVSGLLRVSPLFKILLGLCCVRFPFLCRWLAMNWYFVPFLFWNGQHETASRLYKQPAFKWPGLPQSRHFYCKSQVTPSPFRFHCYSSWIVFSF